MITIGPHRLTHGSLTDPQVDEMLVSETVRALYCDPPWGDGNLAYWRTMNKKQTGADADELNHEALYDRLLELTARYVRGWMCIETGVRWQEVVQERMQKAGLYRVMYYRVSYRSGRKVYPHALIVGSTEPCKEDLPIEPWSLMGYAMVEHVLGALAEPGAIILDPCCGLGLAARATAEHGMRFRGNELNAARLAKTKAVLERIIR